MRLKKKSQKKPLIYAQETTQVPSGTEEFDPSSLQHYETYDEATGTISSPMMYHRIYGPSAYMMEEGHTGWSKGEGYGFSGEGKVITEEGSVGYLPDITYGDRSGTQSLFWSGDTDKRASDKRIPFSIGFDHYANLYNRINKSYSKYDRRKSDEPMTGDSLMSMYNNPTELFSKWDDDTSRLYKNTFTRTNEDGEEVEAYSYNFRLTEDDVKSLDPYRNIFQKDNSHRFGSGNTLIFDSQGNFTGTVLSRAGTSLRGVKFTDEEKNLINQYVKDQAFTSFVTQGASDSELSKQAINIGPLEFEKIDHELTEGERGPMELKKDDRLGDGQYYYKGELITDVPSFIEQDDVVGSDIEGMIGPTVEAVGKKGPGKKGPGGVTKEEWDKMYTFIGDEEGQELYDSKTNKGDTGGETPGGETPGGETPGGDTTGGETPDPDTGGETPDSEVPSGTEEKFTIGGNDYESEEAAMEELKGKPQSQLSEEERNFVKGLKGPQTQRGKKGMRVNKYSKGGKINNYSKGGSIKLKKKKK
jgi:hypothetical protein